MNHLLIITALQSEAEPIIKQYQLEKKHHSEKLFYFQRERITCLTTGVGEKNVRKRLGAFLQELACSNTILINIGIAGGKKDSSKIGTMYLINKITSDKSGKAWLPDILLKTGIPEVQLTTVSKGVTDGGEKYKGLVDMEAAVIFETAVEFFPVHCLVFLKIVSDYMDEVLDSPEQVLPIMSNNLSKLDSIITLMQNSEIVRAPLLNEQHERLLTDLNNTLKLTETQTHQLKNKIEGYIAIKDDDFSFLSNYLHIEINSKQERSKIFYEICTKLSS